MIYDGDHGYPLVYIIKEEGFEICTCFRRVCLFLRKIWTKRSERTATGCYGKFARAKFENLIWLNCGSFIDLSYLHLFRRRIFVQTEFSCRQRFRSDRVSMQVEFPAVEFR